MNLRRIALGVSLLIAATASATALDHVQLKRDGRILHVSGELIVEAQDGGLLVRAPDGKLWAVLPEELVKHTQDDTPFALADREKLAKLLVDELGDEFQVHTTVHYIIAYNTSKAYAQWCGALYERLYSSFYTYWDHRGLKLEEPQQPLVAVVFDSRDSYAGYARPELGDAVGSIIGYYNLQNNRVAMFDLTSTSVHGRRLGTAAQINAALSRPEAADMVATIIHEATHQLAYNAGIHQRLADIPLWLSEGFAMYFETPDLKSKRGWSGIGNVNRPRLIRFRQSLRNRPDDALQSLISSDQRFRDTRTALDAYAEAWALNYYLMKRYPEEYNEYLTILAEKGPLLTDGPELRLKQFQEAFGVEWDELERDFLRQMRKLR